MTLSASAIAIIGITIVFSSFLSAVLGMAGGMILLGVLLAYLDVAGAMILFSTIQFFVNGARVVQWRDYIIWPIFYWYLAGAAVAFIIMWTIAFVPDKATVYLLLGQEKGPRFGSFVAVYGVQNTIDMIDGALARSA